MAKSSTKAKSEYNKKNYVQASLRFKKGEKEKWQEEAAKQGETFNEYIIKALEMRREQDNTNQDGSDTQKALENTFHIDNMDLLSKLPISELIAYINEAVSEKREADKKKQEYALLKESGFFDRDIEELKESKCMTSDYSFNYIVSSIRYLNYVAADKYGKLYHMIEAYPSVDDFLKRCGYTSDSEESKNYKKRAINELFKVFNLEREKALRELSE